MEDYQDLQMKSKEELRGTYNQIIDRVCTLRERDYIPNMINQFGQRAPSDEMPNDDITYFSILREKSISLLEKETSLSPEEITVVQNNLKEMDELCCDWEKGNIFRES